MKIFPIVDYSCDEIAAGTCYEIDSGISGPTLWFSSGVHGDETGPIKAMKTFLKELQDNKIHIIHGKLILIPEANPFAVKQNVRSIEDRNLNRMFGESENIEKISHESKRVIFLKKLIEKTRPDVILDLHSMSGETLVPFLYSPIKEVETATKLGIGFVVSGWSKLSEEAAKRGIRAMGIGLADFGNLQGIPSFTLEAGTHDSPSSEVNAGKFIRNTLSVYSMIENPKFELIGSPDTVTTIEMTEAVFCSPDKDPKISFKYSIHPVNFSKIPANTHIADDNGIPIIIKYDAILVQPTTPEAMVPGNEAFFLGKVVEERKIV